MFSTARAVALAPVARSVLSPGLPVFLPHHPLRALRRGALALLDVERPFLAQLVVTRRCNLACGYCNEYDDFSKPVPTDVVKARIDHLAKLGTLVVRSEEHTSELQSQSNLV